MAYDDQFGLYPALTDVRIKRPSLMDRLVPQDPNSPYQMDAASKHRALGQGLLQLAATLATPNGGNFARSLSSGLLAGTNQISDATQQYGNDAYRGDVMKRTQAEMAQKTALMQGAQQFAKPDGSYDYNGYADYIAQHGDPSGAIDIKDKFSKMGVHNYGDISYIRSADGKSEDPWVQDKTTGQWMPFDPTKMGGPQMAAQAPQGAPQAPQGMPAPTTGGAPQITGDALTQAVQSVESGGNPNAVSPKGAVGLMQTMPNTLRDPGFGVMPARDNSPQEQARVGRDYLAAMTKQYGVQGGLAAYNMGPGAWQASLSKYGTPDAALAHAPAETQAYVPKVLGRVGGVNSAQPAQTASGTMGPVPFGRRAIKPDTSAMSTVDKRKQDVADLEASGIKISPAQRNAYLMTGKMANEDGGALPDDPLAGLDPATASLVKKISTYDALPSSLGRAANRADLIGRATMLNPDFSEAKSQEAYTFKKDMGRSTPGSVGGSVTSLNTIAHHLGTMMQDNAKLKTSDFPLLNRATNALKSGGGSTEVTKFNQDKTFIAEEAAKLVKGGVATESEMQDILAPFDAAGSQAQRNSAISGAAQFVYGRMQAIEQHAQDVLGGMSDGKPLMTPEGRKIMAAAFKLGGHVVPAELDTGNSMAPKSAGKQVVRTGVHNGKKVVQYSDGSVDYAN